MLTCIVLLYPVAITEVHIGLLATGAVIMTGRIFQLADPYGRVTLFSQHLRFFSI
jgi:hypothetical protein